MSRWDEYDRMQERIAEGQQRVQSNNERRDPTPKEIADWNYLIESIRETIRKGVTSSEDWEIKGEWVNVRGGRLFHLDEPLPEINDNRIQKFLTAHRVHIDLKTIRNIRSIIFHDTPGSAKSKLKRFIQHYRDTGKVDIDTLR